MNVPVARDGSFFGPHLERNGHFTVGDKGSEVRFSNFEKALSYLKSRPRARWRRPNPNRNWGIVVAIEWADRRV